MKNFFYNHGLPFTVTFLLTILAALVFVPQAHAQSTPAIPIATGSETGSYYKFVQQAAQICSDTQVRVETSSGSFENLDRLENNTASVVLAQLDIVDLYKRTRDMSNVKLLLPLFPEQVHVYTRSDVTVSAGGRQMFGFTVPGTAQKVQLRDINDLAGRTVAAAGGSIGTAKLIQILGGIPMNLREYPSADAAVKAVIAGEVDAGILVGAQPVGTFTAMKDGVKLLRLLPIPDATASKLSAVYSKANPLVYRQMGEGGNSIPTVQVMSAMMVQNYGKSRMGDAIARFRDCLVREAPEQVTIPGTHPAWRNLRLSAGLNWPVWEYNVQSAAAEAPATRVGNPAKK